MKLKVNEEICIGCGACCGICPKCFEMGEETAKVKVPVIPKEEEENATDAKEGCPVGAIEEENATDAKEGCPVGTIEEAK